MKKFLPAILSAVLVGGIALAGSITIWDSGDTLTSTTLNSNFAHIHNTMVGGHGARLVDADVAANAAIAQSKIYNLATTVTNLTDAGVQFTAAQNRIPRIVARFGVTDVNTACNTTPCTLFVNLPTGAVTSVTRAGAGIYTVNFAARSNTAYAVFVSPGDTTGLRHCTSGNNTTTAVAVTCYLDNDATSAADDAVVNFMLIDDDL